MILRYFYPLQSLPPAWNKIPTKVLLHWPSFGPYHTARLLACQRLAPSNVTVTGLAAAGGIKDRPWTSQSAGISPAVRIAFPDQIYQNLTGKQLTAGISAILDELRPSVVGISGYGMADSRAVLGWCRRNKALAILMTESKADDAPRHFFKELIKKFLVAQFHSAICGGTPHRRYLEQLGMDPARIFDKYDVVDNELFERRAEKIRDNPSSCRHLPGLNDPRPFFLVSSRLIARKNLHNLLKGFALYRKKNSEGWRLIILGTGEDELELKRQVADQAIMDVVFAGFHQFDDLTAYYALAGAFVHPAIQEQWGLVVNEAMACGLPIVISKTVGCARDLVRENENGFKFAPQDVISITDALEKMASDSTDRTDMGQASKKIISEWTPDHFARNFWAAVMAGR